MLTNTVILSGIGGEYPLSATITSEQAAHDKGSRGRMVAAVFSMQGVGYITAALVGFVLLKTVHDLEGSKFRPRRALTRR